jgi:hypothetical protein
MFGVDHIRAMKLEPPTDCCRTRRSSRHQVRVAKIAACTANRAAVRSFSAAQQYV